MTPEEEALQLLEQNNNTGPKEPDNKVIETTPEKPKTENAKPKTEPGPRKTHNPSFWGDDEDDIAAPKPAAPAITDPARTAPTAKIYEMSAKTTVATINLTQITLMRPLMNWRFKKACEKKLGAKFKDALDLVEGDFTPTSDEQGKLKRQLERLLRERDKKIKGIPFSDEEEKDLIYAWKNYYETTGKTMDPGILVACATIGALGRRTIDLALWD